MSAESIVAEFVRSFNDRDLDGFAATLDPEVELHSNRGLLQGIPAARNWATRTPGGVQQTVVVTDTEAENDRVLLRIRRDWRWDEDGTLAASDEMAWFFRLRDDLVLSWRPFVDSDEATAAFTAT